MGNNQVEDNAVREQKVVDKSGGRYDRVILTMLYELGDYSHNQ